MTDVSGFVPAPPTTPSSTAQYNVTLIVVSIAFLCVSMLAIVLWIKNHWVTEQLSARAHVDEIVSKLRKVDNLDKPFSEDEIGEAVDEVNEKLIEDHISN